MNTLSPTKVKKTRIYHKVDREEQAKLIQLVELGNSQRSVAKHNGIPKSTLHYWTTRKKN